MILRRLCEQVKGPHGAKVPRIDSPALRSEAHRPGERIAVPLAGDDPEALKLAARLVEEAGFEPVIVGPLARAKDFDVGSPVFARALTARALRQALGR